jgi:hypothetical protein
MLCRRAGQTSAGCNGGLGLSGRQVVEKVPLALTSGRAVAAEAPERRSAGVPRWDDLAECTPTAYTPRMRFIETPIFTRAILAQLDDEEYQSLQLALLYRPERGTVIRGSGGLRKMRWRLPGQGKRGGLRVIYFWDDGSETFYLLYAYCKNEQEDLTAGQLRILRRLVREEFG